MSDPSIRRTLYNVKGEDDSGDESHGQFWQVSMERGDGDYFPKNKIVLYIWNADDEDDESNVHHNVSMVLTKDEAENFAKDIQELIKSMRGRPNVIH